jgi:hypothetical protein
MGPGDHHTVEGPRVEEETPRFVPVRPASRRRRAALFIVGPLLWVAGIAAVAWVAHQGRSITIALVALGAALLVSVVTLLPMRARRVRQERQRWR